MRVSKRQASLAVAAALAAGTVISAFGAKPGYGLTSFGNLAQAGLLVLATLVFWGNARSSRGNTRVFNALLALGCLTWFAAQLCWVYYEVWLRTEVPDPSLVDSLFFLHIVPFMAAMALRPHRQRGSGLHLGSIDLLLLLSWWVYLYAFVVIPWQYVRHSPPLYAMSFNALYAVQHIVLLAALGYHYLRSSGTWRAVYGNLLAASATYALSSRLINWAIDRRAYYTGSVYDIPLVVAMAWFVYTAVLAGRLRGGATAEAEIAESAAVWPARMAMAAILSLPLMGVWSFANEAVPQEVQMFRIVLTLGAILALTFLLFLKQHLMDRELIRLVQTTRDAFNDLQQLQAQLIHTEKLASLGQLVAGAAHEINNPLTAILGYADILAAKGSLGDDHRALLEKIEQQARRTKALVSHLLSFAKQVPAEKTMVSVGTLLRHAVKLRETDLSRHDIALTLDVPDALPNVYGDSNQLLQVCQHILSNAIDALQATPGGALLVAARASEGDVVLEFSDNGPGIKDPQRIFDPFYTTKPVGRGSGLGLSACYGIVQEHQGTITCFNRPEGGATIAICLPIAEAETPAEDVALPTRAASV
jgi:signal transduction histidine kinase